MGFFDKIQDTISSATEQTKAKAQETQLRRERKQKLESLGEQVLQMYSSGQLAMQELVPACQEIEQIDQQIAAEEARAQTARQQMSSAGGGVARQPSTPQTPTGAQAPTPPQAQQPPGQEPPPPQAPPPPRGPTKAPPQAQQPPGQEPPPPPPPPGGQQ